MTIVRYKGRDLAPHKAIVNPIIGSRTVLTHTPWTFVSLMLKRTKQDMALFYWEQAEEFYRASRGLPLRSSPLLLYYCYMNAVKTLLSAKKIPFNEHHGVRRFSLSPASARKNIAKDGVKILNNGILPALSTYYNEPETSKNHTLQQIFFNLPFIHRTYCLSYPRQVEMFIPIVAPTFIFDKAARKCFLRFKMSKDHSSQHTVNRLAPVFVPDPTCEGYIRSAADVALSSASRLKASDLKNISNLRQQLSLNLYFINGAQTLWYVKAATAGPYRIERQEATLVLAAMHYLSELCRYRPLELASHLSGKYNWLLSEFIQMSPVQFIDDIASELTGHQVQFPNSRPAN